MGRPKLLLPVDGIPLIARVVQALRAGGAGPVAVVVAPPGLVEGAGEVAEAADRAGGQVVTLDCETPDMRATIEAGLDHLGRLDPPPDAFLLAPGDAPAITPELVARLIARARLAPGRPVAPRHSGRRGHPILLPWSLAGAIRALPAGQGVDAAIAAHAGEVEVIDEPDPWVLDDLDTPDDYRRWREGG